MCILLNHANHVYPRAPDMQDERLLGGAVGRRAKLEGVVYDFFMQASVPCVCLGAVADAGGGALCAPPCGHWACLPHAYERPVVPCACGCSFIQTRKQARPCRQMWIKACTASSFFPQASPGLKCLILATNLLSCLHCSTATGIFPINQALMPTSC